MKYTYEILRLGLINPRHYIEGMHIKWRHILLVSLLATLFMTLSNTLSTYPEVNSLMNDFTDSIEYLPEYNISDNQLTIHSGSKALYYDSKYFQLIVDDTIKSNGSKNNLPISKEKADLIDPQTFFGLYILKDQILVSIPGSLAEFPQFTSYFGTTNVDFSNAVKDFNMKNPIIISSIIFYNFIFSFISYTIQILLIAAFCGVFNFQLNRRLSMSLRARLAILVSFIPIIILSILSIGVNGIPMIPIITSLSLFIIYQGLKNHTDFLRNFMAQIDIKDIKDMSEFLSKIEKQMEEPKEQSENDTKTKKETHLSNNEDELNNHSTDSDSQKESHKSSDLNNDDD